MSGSSERRKLTWVRLPAEGWNGKPPAWPLPTGTVREKKVWRTLWKSPQAAAWSEESWRWHTVALYATLLVRAEKRDCPAGVLAQLHRFADQLGLTPAGMRDNGWVLAKDELEARRPASAPPVEAPARRLRAVE